MRGIGGPHEPHKTLPPERDLAADLDDLAAEHAGFAAIVGPLISELRMLIQQQSTKMAMLEAELHTLRAAMPVRIMN